MTLESSYSRDEQAIRDNVHKYESSLNEGNFEKWISQWLEKGIQLPPHSPMNKGKETIAKENKVHFDNMKLEMKITDILEVRVEGNIGVSICTYNFFGTPKDGGERVVIEPDGKALSVFERQSDNTWKILYDCFNSNV